MPNSIVEHVSVETNGSLSIEQKAQLIRERVEAMLSKASLQQVAERMPEYTPVVQGLIAELDVNKPLTLARVGSWALEDQAEAGLDLLAAVQQGPSHQSLLAVDAFDADLRKRIKPLEERLQMRAEKSVAQTSFMARFIGLVQTVVVSKEKRRAMQSEGLKKEMQELKEGQDLLAGIVAQTVIDATTMKSLLAQNKHVPQLIADQVEKANETHAEALEKLYLSLVAVNEFQSTLSKETIPALEAKAIAPNAMDADVDAVQRAKEALGLLETRRTDLIAAFLNTSLQRGMTAEMGKINASSAIEMERLEAIALPQMLGMLGTLGLQQRTGEVVAATKAANKILGDTTRATAKGFAQVLQLSKEADQARIMASQSVVDAAKETLVAIGQFREHEAGHIERQKAIQTELITAVGNIRVAAARITTAPNSHPMLTDQSSTDALALQVTGVSLAEQRAAVTPEVMAPTVAQPSAEILPPAETPTRPAAPAEDKAASLFRAARKSRNARD